MSNIIIDALLARRSVRKYTGDAISEEVLNEILMAGLIAPKGRNISSVELVLVTDKEALVALSKCRPTGPGMLAGADSAIVVLGDPEKTDVWTEDCSIANAYMHLVADSLGIGSCWVQIRNRMCDDTETAGAYVKRLLDIPEHYEVEAILSLGMPAEHAPARTLEEVDWTLAHRDRF